MDFTSRFLPMDCMKNPDWPRSTRPDLETLSS
jgi:hypothetical protein